MSDFETFQEELPSKEKFYYVLDFNPNLDGGRDGGGCYPPCWFSPNNPLPTQNEPLKNQQVKG